jgi:hypothetical protein
MENTQYEFTKKPIATGHSKVIHVVVPARVAYDLDSMNKVTKEVLNDLGCPGCHSGFDLRFDFETQFRFDLNLNRIPSLNIPDLKNGGLVHQ